MISPNCSVFFALETAFFYHLTFVLTGLPNFWQALTFYNKFLMKVFNAKHWLMLNLIFLQFALRFLSCTPTILPLLLHN